MTISTNKYTLTSIRDIYFPMILSQLSATKFLETRPQKPLLLFLSLISKFMTSKAGSQTIAIQILPNTSPSKGDQIIKLS